LSQVSSLNSIFLYVIENSGARALRQPKSCRSAKKHIWRMGLSYASDWPN